MSTARFLGQLREGGIELRAEGDKLVVNAPKGAVTESLGDEIRRRKPELLAFLRMGAEANASPSKSGRIPRASLAEGSDGARHAPASFGQRRLFYLDQLEPGLAVYNVPVAFWLIGELDIDALRSAIDAIIQRHSVLRTTLELGHDGVRQQIAKELSIALDVVPLVDEVDPDRRERRCRDVLTEHACRGFDLVSGPLIRGALIQLGPRENVLLVTAHHVVTDGWSQDVFQAELLALYESNRQGVAPSLASLPIEYADYATWQIQAKEGADREKRLQFWRDTLRQPLPVLELPTAHARPQMAPTEGAIESVALPADLVEPLTAMGRRDGATLFMVLLTAYAALLGRISGQNEVVIGTPIANRTHAETLDLIGYFANTLALRIDMSERPTFRELLRRVREVCLGAYANQDIPFEELVESLHVDRDLSRSPIFQTIFAFEDAMPTPARTTDAGTLRVERRETVHAKVARTDLSAWVSATPDGLLVTLEYPTALFDSAAVSRLLGHFRVLLRAVADGADGPVDTLPILSAEERKRILLEWNDTARPLPAVVGAHQLIERQVDATPDRPAVVFGADTLSYLEVDRWANQLAHHLAALGAGPGSLVGVFIDRSAEMVIALLAIAKVGGSYVPIDPEYPKERIALMIEDSGLSFVVSTTALLQGLPTTARVIAMDGDAPSIAQCSSERLACRLPAGDGSVGTASEHACYVIYTSGSTGRPKGVVVSHRALINFLSSMANQPGLSARDTLVAVTTLSFDIAGLEMFLPLTVGAKLVIASKDQVSDGDALRGLLERSEATVMQATPSTWRLLIGAGWSGDPSFKVLCGGEGFPPELLSQLLSRAGSVWNMYGPTETTIWSTCVQLSAGDRITIGRPIDNTTVYVLDPLGQPVPVGVPGELVIGGLGVSHGYLNRAELTDARFVDDPFRGVVGARMYKTGDLASFRADGQLVYHRRLDHQVKVRGYRIELGEIETVLGENEAVAQCAVIVREDRPGDTRLVGYIFPRSGWSVTPTDLRKHLRKRLPEYMIPQHLVELDSFPLTPAGKISRKELPAPAGAMPTAEARAPQTPNEIVLAKIWKDVLGTDVVSATDNFFDIGGHSLLSMLVVARVQSETATRISPRDLLLSSLEQIAVQLPAGGAPEPLAELRAQAPSSRVPVAPEPRRQSDAHASQAGLVSGLVSRLKGKLFG